MTEKELEKLFQEKLKNREVAFNPASWEKMKPLLANVKPAAAWWQTRRAAIFVGLVGVSSLAYFGTTFVESEQPSEKAMPSFTVGYPEGFTSNSSTESLQVSPSSEGTHQNSSSRPGNEPITYEEAQVEDAVIEESLSEDQNRVRNSDPVVNSRSMSAEGDIASREPSSPEVAEEQNFTAQTTKTGSEGSVETEQENVLTTVQSENTPVTTEGTESVEPTVSKSRGSEAVTPTSLANHHSEPIDQQGFPTENTQGLPTEEKMTSDEVTSLDSPKEEIIINRANSQRSLSNLHEIILLAGTNASFPYGSSLSESNSPAFSYLAGIEYRYYTSPKYSIRTGFSLATTPMLTVLEWPQKKFMTLVQLL